MNKLRGFTLVELLFGMAIAAILGAIAFPSLQAPIIKARRIDALGSLMQLQIVEERWRANANSYASLHELQQPTLSAQAHYQLNVAQVTAQSFEATAVAQGAQARDKECKVLKLKVLDGEPTYASGPDTSTSNEAAANKRCWNQ